MCRRPAARLGISLGGRGRGRHANSSLSGQSVEQATLSQTFRDSRVHDVPVLPLQVQLSPMSSLGQGCGDAASVPRGSWHGLCSHSSDLHHSLSRQRTTEPMGEEPTVGEIRSRKLRTLCCCCEDIVTAQIKFPLDSVYSHFFLFFSPARTSFPSPPQYIFFSLNLICLVSAEIKSSFLLKLKATTNNTGMETYAARIKSQCRKICCYY